MGMRGFERVIRAVARDAARHQRLAAADQHRRLREHERALAAARREAIRSEKENIWLEKEAAREAKLLYLQSREEEATDANQEVAERLAALANVLPATLSIDDAIDFETLRVRERPPVFNPPAELMFALDEPSKSDFTRAVEPPSGFRKLIPGARKRYEKALLKAEELYAAKHAEWHRQEEKRKQALAPLEAEHEAALKAFEEKKALRDAELEAFKVSYRAGEPDAIVAYCSMVLERSSYPDGFPQHFSVAYVSASKQLVVEYELPAPEIVPSETDFRYNKARDEIIAKPRKAAETKALYADVIAAVALRTLHEVFEADHFGHIEACCFNGYVSTVDPSTGKDILPHLISVRTTRERFAEIDLARIDKGVCLRNLGAQVSRAAAEAQPVKPIIEFDMADARFVDQHDLVSGLGAAQNLMELSPTEFEHLVANLFGQMGLES